MQICFQVIVANYIDPFNVFIGYETTASTLTFASYILAMHPEIQERLRTEIIEAKEQCNGSIDYETLMSLTLLDAFIKETLRMYPPVPMVDRLVTITRCIKLMSLNQTMWTGHHIEIRRKEY